MDTINEKPSTRPQDTDRGLEKGTGYRRIQALCLKALLNIYKYGVGPFMRALTGPGFSSCRFSPSCSEYAAQSFEEHAPWKAFYLTIRRLLRCHPWSQADSNDPVPGPDHTLKPIFYRPTKSTEP